MTAEGRVGLILEYAHTSQQSLFTFFIGSTFKPLNPTKKVERSKKRGRRTTIMGIPQHVQKELGTTKLENCYYPSGSSFILS